DARAAELLRDVETEQPVGARGAPEIAGDAAVAPEGVGVGEEVASDERAHALAEEFVLVVEERPLHPGQSLWRSRVARAAATTGRSIMRPLRATAPRPAAMPAS